MYLLDTNVVSELRSPRPNRSVLAWLAGVDDADLRLSAVTIGEIQAGVEITRGQDPAKAAEIEAWLERLMASAQVIGMDGQTFRVYARLMHGRDDRLAEDAMIAATAQVHRLTVVTRNIRDFTPFGTPTVNPFEAR